MKVKIAALLSVAFASACAGAFALGRLSACQDVAYATRLVNLQSHSRDHSVEEVAAINDELEEVASRLGVPGTVECTLAPRFNGYILVIVARPPATGVSDETVQRLDDIARDRWLSVRGSAQPSPTVPSAHLETARQAHESFERGNYAEAERLYEGILADVPTNLYALSNLGVVRFRSGNFKGAADAFERAIVIAPDDAFSHRTLGIVYYSLSRFDDAARVLTCAIALNPKDACAHNYLGIVYSQQGLHERAAKELEKARQLDPSYAEPPQENPDRRKLAIRGSERASSEHR